MGAPLHLWGLSFSSSVVPSYPRFSQTWSENIKWQIPEISKRFKLSPVPAAAAPALPAAPRPVRESPRPASRAARAPPR